MTYMVTEIGNYIFIKNYFKMLHQHKDLITNSICNNDLFASYVFTQILTVKRNRFT